MRLPPRPQWPVDTTITVIVVSTGHWGCGVFNSGNRDAKSLIQASVFMIPMAQIVNNLITLMFILLVCLYNYTNIKTIQAISENKNASQNMRSAAPVRGEIVILNTQHLV